LGADHPDVGRVLNRLGSLYFEKCEFLKAEDHFKRALQIRTEKLGADHSRVAQTYKHLLTLYQVQERYNDAIDCGNKALEILQKVHGMQSIHVAGVYNRLGHLINMQSTSAKEEKGKEYLEKAVQIRQRDKPMATQGSSTSSIPTTLLQDIVNFSFSKNRPKNTQQQPPVPIPAPQEPLTMEMKKKISQLMEEIVNFDRQKLRKVAESELPWLVEKAWWKQGYVLNVQLQKQHYVPVKT